MGLRIFAATIVAMLVFSNATIAPQAVAAETSACTLSYSSPGPGSGEGSLVGRVVDAATRLPLAANVEAVGGWSLWIGFTSATGSFRADLPPGRYTITVRSPEFQPLNSKIAIIRGKRAVATFSLRRHLSDRNPAMASLLSFSSARCTPVQVESPRLHPQGQGTAAGELVSPPAARGPGAVDTGGPNSGSSGNGGGSLGSAGGNSTLEASNGVPALAGGTAGSNGSGIEIPPSGSVSAQGQTCPAAPGQSLVPVRTVGVSADGNFLLNGAPFLIVAVQKMSYGWWLHAGYTPQQADAKLAEVKTWGVNTMNNEHWMAGPFNNGKLQDEDIWERHGLYWMGSATIDLGSVDAQGIFGTPAGNVLISDIVNRYKNRPNLLRWWIVAEANPALLPLDRYASAVAVIRAADPNRIVGELVISSPDPDALVGQTLIQQPFYEEVIRTAAPGGVGGVGIQQLYDHAKAAVESAARHSAVPGVSTTPVPELFGRTVGYPTHVDEVRRHFMLQVGLGVRAYEILWGPNQRDGVFWPRNGDAGLSQGIHDVWKWTGQAIAQVKALETVILAPGSWTRLTTTPRFVRFPGLEEGNPQWDFRGVFASMKKGLDGYYYVVAVNLQQVNHVEHAVQHARIEVGMPGARVARMFENEVVTYTGGTITDSFRPMGVHVYRIEPAGGVVPLCP